MKEGPIRLGEKAPFNERRAAQSEGEELGKEERRAQLIRNPLDPFRDP